MKIIIAALTLALLLAGCAHRPNPDPTSRAIDSYTQEKPWEADVLHDLHNEEIVKTPGDVGKVMMMLEMSCPFMNFPGATLSPPESVQVNLATNWQMNLTIEQIKRFQAVQQEFCAHR